MSWRLARWSKRKITTTTATTTRVPIPTKSVRIPQPFQELARPRSLPRRAKSGNLDAVGVYCHPNTHASFARNQRPAPVPRTYGFHSDTQRDRFMAAAQAYGIGGGLLRPCGAKLRNGRFCTQLALEGEARCLMHAGPYAARRFRDKQLARMQTGSVSAEEFARSEARRARNRLLDGWKKDPRLPGATIDLGADEAAFVAAAKAKGIDVAALYPAAADWLRWRWQRYQRDRPADWRWGVIVAADLPKRLAAADRAVEWQNLGDYDRRTREGRALAQALMNGGLRAAQRVASELQATAAAAAQADPAAARGKRQKAKRSPAVAGRPVVPWKTRQTVRGAPAGKRALPDRIKAPKALPAVPAGPVARKAAATTVEDEGTALLALLNGAGAQVRRMFGAIPRQEDRLAFLRDLQTYSRNPSLQGPRDRWLGWVAIYGR